MGPVIQHPQSHIVGNPVSRNWRSLGVFRVGMRGEGPESLRALALGLWGSNHETRILTGRVPSSLARRSSQIAPKSTLVCIHSQSTRFSPHKKESPIPAVSRRFDTTTLFNTACLSWTGPDPVLVLPSGVYAVSLMHQFLGNLWALSAAPVRLRAQLPSGVTTPLIIFERRGSRWSSSDDLAAML